MKPISGELLEGRERAVKHWQRVMATPGLPPMSYHYAQSALKQLGHPWREPGCDDE